MIQKGESLESLAMEQLQKEFLAIRIISYKMYEKFTQHSHEDMLEEIRKTR